jgi:hypothetical protein
MTSETGRPSSEAPDDRRRQVIAGLILVVVGGLLLAGQWWPDVGRYVPLAVGLGLLAAFVVTRQYGWLVAGCIVGGVGVGVVLASSTSGNTAGGWMLVALGGGFLAIWVVSLVLRLAEHHWWPLIPGGILSVVGVLVMAGGEARRLLEWWPIILVLIGVVILIQAFTSRREPR